MHNLELRAAEVIAGGELDDIELSRLATLLTELDSARLEATAAHDRHDAALAESKDANRRVELATVEIERLMPAYGVPQRLWADGIVDVDANLASARAQVESFTGSADQKAALMGILDQLEQSRGAAR